MVYFVFLFLAITVTAKVCHHQVDSVTRDGIAQEVLSLPDPRMQGKGVSARLETTAPWEALARSHVMQDTSVIAMVSDYTTNIETVGIILVLACYAPPPPTLKKSGAYWYWLVMLPPYPPPPPPPQLWKKGEHIGLLCSPTKPHQLWKSREHIGIGLLCSPHTPPPPLTLKRWGAYWFWLVVLPTLKKKFWNFIYKFLVKIYIWSHCICLCGLFPNLTFSKNSFRNTIRVSNSSERRLRLFASPD